MFSDVKVEIANRLLLIWKKQLLTINNWTPLQKLIIRLIVGVVKLYYVKIKTAKI